LGRLARAAIVVASALGVWLIPTPDGITAASWRLLAIFVGTVVGLIARPAPVGAVVLTGVTAAAITGALTPARALAGYADPTVWMVFCAFQIAGGMIKTGLGRRLALGFIRAMGRTSLGLAYALVVTDALLGMVVPSVSARSGGILFPIARSLSETLGSTPGPTATRLGSFLLPVVYHCDVIVCAMFLTGQASNPLIASFAKQAAGVELNYATWALGAVVPGVIALLLTPLVVYYASPPELTKTPAAAQFAQAELSRLGPMTRPERLMLVVFALITILWSTTALHGIEYALVALLAVVALLMTGVLEWDDVLSDKTAWDVFIWYGGIYQLARALAESGVTELFAKGVAGLIAGMPWVAALAVLLVIYFYAHYGFASITAHASAMFMPFLAVLIAAGAPTMVAVLLLAYLTNLTASLTHYGTTSTPIYYGAGYLTQASWWRVGFLVSLPNIAIWTLVGMAWWKVLGWW
jgi:divalent anion:Na+ symporter, DASS family